MPQTSRLGECMVRLLRLNEQYATPRVRWLITLGVWIGSIAALTWAADRAVGLNSPPPVFGDAASSDALGWELAAGRGFALNLADLDKQDEAVSHLKKILADDPNDMRTYLALGSVYASKENFRDAATLYDQAVEHLKNPRSVVPESIMPAYAFLSNTDLNISNIADHLSVNRVLGTPYSDDMVANADADMKLQASADADATALKAFTDRYPKAVTGDLDGDPKRLTEMDALVAYLQMLGTLVDFQAYNPAENER